MPRSPVPPGGPGFGLDAALFGGCPTDTARTSRRWTLATYLVFTALAAGALAVGAGVLYLFWAMTCDC